MKILQINKYHYLRGGSDKVYLETSKLLQKNGHDIIHFSTVNPKNEFSPTASYFVKDPDFLGQNLFMKIKSSFRYIYSYEAKRKLTKLIEDHRPEIAHLHIFFGELSLSILSVLRKHKIPVVMTLHDFKLLCPIYSLYDQNNSICEKCAKGNLLHCIQKKCNKGSYAYSTLASLESYVRELWYSYDKHIDHFLAVSKFSMYKHLEYRDDIADKISCLHNFIEYSSSSITHGHESYYCYFGRMSREKGLMTLVKAFEENGLELKLAGDGPYRQELEQYCQHNSIRNITFVGHQSGKALEHLVGQAKFSIVPSECYESFGLVVVESMRFGTPVIASNIGAISELVEHQHTGFLFTSGQFNSMQQAIMLADSQSIDSYQELSENCIQFVNKFNSQNHYTSLMRTYEEVVNRNRESHP
ncbi:MAG: glycosyltransferase [Reichenbachiella sp.]